MSVIRSLSLVKTKAANRYSKLSELPSEFVLDTHTLRERNSSAEVGQVQSLVGSQRDRLGQRTTESAMTAVLIEATKSERRLDGQVFITTAIEVMCGSGCRKVPSERLPSKF